MSQADNLKSAIYSLRQFCGDNKTDEDVTRCRETMTGIRTAYANLPTLFYTIMDEYSVGMKLNAFKYIEITVDGLGYIGKLYQIIVSNRLSDLQTSNTTTAADLVELGDLLNVYCAAQIETFTRETSALLKEFPAFGHRIIDDMDAESKKIVHQLEEKFIETVGENAVRKLRFGHIIASTDGGSCFQDALNTRSGYVKATRISDNAFKTCRIADLSCYESGADTTCETIDMPTLSNPMKLMYISVRNDTDATKIRIAQELSISVDRVKDAVRDVLKSDADYVKVRPIINDVEITADEIDSSKRCSFTPSTTHCLMWDPSANPNEMSFTDQIDGIETTTVCYKLSNCIDLLYDLKVSGGVDLISYFRDLVQQQQQQQQQQQEPQQMMITMILLILVIIVLVVFISRFGIKSTNERLQMS